MEFIEEFEKAVSQWEMDTPDELLFARLQSKVVKALTPPEAFEAIEDVVGTISRQSDKYVFYETVITLHALARQSDTTEAPSAFLVAVPALKERCAALDGATQNALKELLKYYRLNTIQE